MTIMSVFSAAAAAAFLCSVMLVHGVSSAPAAAVVPNVAELWKWPELKKAVEFQKLIRLDAETPQPKLGAKSVRPVNKQCGRSKYPDAGNMDLPASRIVGGQEARSHEFPWQASFRYNGEHFCGGSIVAPSWILTAAHCFAWFTVEDVAQRITVAVGEHNRNATSTVRQVMRLSYVVIGDLDLSTFTGDIALVKLTAKIRFSRNIAPVCLPASDSVVDFKKCVVSGWGTLYYGGYVAETLQYATLNVTSNAICNATYNEFSYGIYDSMMCAVDNEGDTTRSVCNGDSGGPLALKGADGRFTVAGITSWGIYCAYGYPAVFTRVSSYMDSVCQITGIKCTVN